MRIQHNIAALNSYRQLSGNNSAVSKNLEKLSSGYKINRAGDDAAGLAISEKMRAQITGLETAQKNANDGISLVQTAEGALTEVHSMLNRMVELADQSANGTYDDKTDRANLQKEVKSLLDEIDRIADGTNFNGINLLDGSLGGATVTGVTPTQNGVQSITLSGGNSSVGTPDFEIKMNENGQVTIAKGANEVKGLKWKAVGSANAADVSASATVDKKGGTVTFEAVIDETVATAEAAKIYKGLSVSVTVDAAKAADGSFVKFNDAGGAATVAKGNGLTLQIGDTADDFNQLTVSVGSMKAKSLGIDNVDISSQTGAQTAVGKIKDAINSVSSTRGDLGAIQNRLEHTINNLSVTTENMTAAESRIRDTDMAKEMMAYTKNNILVQASQAMLAQANQIPQGVLQLLQ